MSDEVRGKFRMEQQEPVDHIVAQGHAHTGHLERVGEAVVDEDAAGQREHLSLVLQPAERSRENQSVVVALELRPVVVALGVAMFLSEPLVGNELKPVHSCKVREKS